MASESSSPSFLQSAKLISGPTQPAFLEKAKKIEEPQEEILEEENLQRQIDQAIAQQTSRQLEGLFGLPGDIINFAGSIFGYDIGAPGSEKLRELSESATLGYTKPDSETGEMVGEVLQDMTLFALPGAKHYSLARNLGIPIAANLAKQGLKELDVGEGKQAAAKLGTMVLLDLFSHRKGLGTAKQLSNQYFREAEQAIPKGLSIKSSNLEANLDNLEKLLKAGGKRPTTADALEKIGEIREQIKNGKIDLKELYAFRPAINELIDKYKGFDIATPPKLRSKIINNLNKVKGEVIDAAEEYGKKFNPEFLEASRKANSTYAAIEQSNKIQKFIQKHVGSKISSLGAKTLLGIGGIGAGLKSPLLATTAVVGGAPAYKLFKTILRSKNKTLRNHYFNILKGSAAGDAPMVIRNAKALDKELENMDDSFLPEED